MNRQLQPGQVVIRYSGLDAALFFIVDECNLVSIKYWLFLRKGPQIKIPMTNGH